MPPTDPSQEGAPTSAEQIRLDPILGQWFDPNTGLVMDTWSGSWHDPETSWMPEVHAAQPPPPPGYYYGPFQQYGAGVPVKLFPIPGDQAAQVREATNPGEIFQPGPDGTLQFEHSSAASSLVYEPPVDEEQDVTPLQFGNTANFDNTAPPSDEGEYEEQDVTDLQFGNTANFDNTPDYQVAGQPPPGEPGGETPPSSQTS
jgi:hypothetical protein